MQGVLNSDIYLYLLSLSYIMMKPSQSNPNQTKPNQTKHSKTELSIAEANSSPNLADWLDSDYNLQQMPMLHSNLDNI